MRIHGYDLVHLTDAVVDGSDERGFWGCRQRLEICYSWHNKGEE
jgi:hypothetical protein